MSEPTWSLPMSRRELIARCEALEAALRKIESNDMRYDLTACAQIARAALEAKSYPAWLGSPALIDRIDAKLLKGIPFEEALQECAEWAELRSEVIFQLREYYARETAPKCPDCGVYYVKDARHFSGCPSQPGATAETSARTYVDELDSAGKPPTNWKGEPLPCPAPETKGEQG